MSLLASRPLRRTSFYRRHSHAAMPSLARRDAFGRMTRDEVEAISKRYSWVDLVLGFVTGKSQSLLKRTSHERLPGKMIAGSYEN